MPNTTNFNWVTPADTDLVKDGAAAIRTLGNGIDTSLVDLKGGTTGQILSKASNTDLDYTWITNDVGDITNVGVTSPITGGGSSGSVTIGIDDGTTTQKGAVQLEDSTSSTSTTKAATPNSVKSAYDLANAAIPKSLVDAAGDLIYATADNTVARLALGTAGKVLTVNSGATAPEWATPSGGGLVFVAAQTFSAVASHSMNSIFTSTYANYRIILEVTGTGDFLYVRLRASGTDKTTANYQSSIQYADKSVAAASHDENGTQWARLALLGKTDASISFDVIGPQLTQNTLISQQGGYFKTTSTTNIGTQHGAGLFKVTDSVDGITFFADSGNITGKVKVYGYANS